MLRARQLGILNLVLAGCVASPVDAQEQLLFKVSDLNCVSENMQTYLNVSKSDPLTIVVSACPEPDIRAALKQLQQNNMFRREPSKQGNLPTQIAALSAVEWRCLLRRAQVATAPIIKVYRGAICE